uniref:Putative von Willebrand domain containing protein n=1 Tax=viral metagenome TaxID=1070528 RepID=A0A6M3J9P1_9ZZZZ
MLANVPDTRSAIAGAIAIGAGTNQQIIGRPGWRYEFRSPILSEGANIAKPQGVLFLDSDTVLFSVHMNDTESRVFKVRLSDAAVLGQFSFGTTTHRHVAAFARRSNGEVWAGDYDSLSLLRLDLDTSFATGEAEITHTYSASSLPGLSAIEFATIGGTEYLLSGQYSTTETNSFLKLIQATDLSGSDYVTGDEFRNWNIGRRVQGLAMRSGKLLVARNALWANTTTLSGYIQEFDIDGMVTGLANNASVNSTTNPQYLLNQWDGPSTYVEDLAVHPVSKDVFTSTEGLYGVADFDGFLALWSSNLSPSGVRNDYTLEYFGSNLSVKMNRQLWGLLPWTLTAPAGVLVVGGPPVVAPGFGMGYTWAQVSNLLVQNNSVSSEVADTLFSGGYETGELDVLTLTLTNPGAESGDTTGWTVESGGMTVRQASPLPYAGAYYFTGGSFVQSVSRQRLDLVAQGALIADLDAGTMWAKIRWKQSAYSNQDPGAMGLRMLTAAAATISTHYGPIAWTQGGGGAAGPWFWLPRSFPVDIPSGTRNLDALYNAGGRTSGTANDFYVDDIDIKLYSK